MRWKDTLQGAVPWANRSGEETEPGPPLFPVSGVPPFRRGSWPSGVGEGRPGRWLCTKQGRMMSPRQVNTDQLPLSPQPAPESSQMSVRRSLPPGLRQGGSVHPSSPSRGRQHPSPSGSVPHLRQGLKRDVVSARMSVYGHRSHQSLPVTMADRRTSGALWAGWAGQ